MNLFCQSAFYELAAAAAKVANFSTTHSLSAVSFSRTSRVVLSSSPFQSLHTHTHTHTSRKTEPLSYRRPTRLFLSLSLSLYTDKPHTRKKIGRAHCHRRLSRGSDFWSLCQQQRIIKCTWFPWTCRCSAFNSCCLSRR